MTGSTEGRAVHTWDADYVNLYRKRVFEILRHLMEGYTPVRSALDFGCGDAWFARRLADEGLSANVVAVDVKRRPRTFFPVEIYDGSRLPYEDRSFDLCFAVDVLHHCSDPRGALLDLIRCTDRFLLVKDHTHQGALGRAVLAFLDELGNRRFGISSTYRYQRGWEWLDWIESATFSVEALEHPARCHKGLLGRLTNSLQWVGLFRRGGESGS